MAADSSQADQIIVSANPLVSGPVQFAAAPPPTPARGVQHPGAPDVRSEIVERLPYTFDTLQGQPVCAPSGAHRP